MDSPEKQEAFNIKDKELELKYSADGVNMDKFDEFSRSMNPERTLEIASWDVYFASPTDSSKLPFEFMRLRLGKRPELTIKIKTDEKNNNNRIEVDVPLDPNISQEELVETVKMFTRQFGFVENFRIFKYCKIYFYEKIDTVYYVVYNEAMKEKGRFIEIEARKDVKFDSSDEAWNLIKDYEQRLSQFGITPQSRMRRSQWELWKKT